MNHAAASLRTLTMAVGLALSAITCAKVAFPGDAAQSNAPPQAGAAAKHVRICKMGVSGCGFAEMAVEMLRAKGWTVDFKFAVVIGTESTPRTRSLGRYRGRKCVARSRLEVAGTGSHQVKEFEAAGPIDYLIFTGYPFVGPTFHVEPAQLLADAAYLHQMRPTPTCCLSCRAVLMKTPAGIRSSTIPDTPDSWHNCLDNAAIYERIHAILHGVAIDPAQPLPGRPGRESLTNPWSGSRPYSTPSTAFRKSIAGAQRSADRPASAHRLPGKWILH